MLARRKRLGQFTLAVQRTSQVVAGIANRLEFTHFTQHAANLYFRFITQVVFADLFQESGYLQFHAVGQVFLLFYLTIEKPKP